jgi:hypothetical protein
MKTIIIAIFLCLSANAFSQDKALVESAVRDYVDGFYYGDTAKICNSISRDVIKHGYYKGKNATEYVRDTMTFQQCVDYAKSIAKRGLNPNIDKFPKLIEVYDVMDKTASAKLTAWWGMDYILLSKTDGKWMITHILWQSPEKSY